MHPLSASRHRSTAALLPSSQTIEDASAPAPASVFPADKGDEVWSQARRALRPQDQSLLGPSRRWLQRLPPRRRPARLAAHYPRVVNRIALCWSDPGLSMQVLTDLLTDRRGGRSGFAAPIVHELRRLQRFNAER